MLSRGQQIALKINETLESITIALAVSEQPLADRIREASREIDLLNTDLSAEAPVAYLSGVRIVERSIADWEWTKSFVSDQSPLLHNVVRAIFALYADSIAAGSKWAKEVDAMVK